MGRTVGFGVLAFVLAGCPGGAPGPGPAGSVAPTCRITLPPRAAAADPSPPPPGLPPFAIERSTIVANVELPFATLAQSLEKKIGRRVAEERDQDIGLAGRLEYTVDRGAFHVGVQGDALVVDTPLDGHVRACAKAQCYASCDPQLRAVARISLRLSTDYKFRPSQVRLEVVRGCEVKALGGFLRVDVTPILQARLVEESRKIEAQIDHELPDPRPEAQRLWTEVGKTRALPLGACVVVSPEGIVHGAPSSAPDAARLRLALLARPEVRVRCNDAASPASPASPPAPLPPLRDDPALAPEGDVHLAVVLPSDAAASAVGGSPETADLHGAQARLVRASGTARSLAIELSGDACGEAAVRADGAAWDPSGRALRLTGAAPLAGEVERFAAVGLDASGVARAVEHTAVPVPIAPEDLRTLLPDLARGMSDDRALVSAAVSSARPGGAGLRGAELVAVVDVRGSVTLRGR
jgi:hypothetical protein